MKPKFPFPHLPPAAPGPNKLPPPDTADERVTRARRIGTRQMSQPTLLLAAALLLPFLAFWTYAYLQVRNWVFDTAMVLAAIWIVVRLRRRR